MQHCKGDTLRVLVNPIAEGADLTMDGCNITAGSKAEPRPRGNAERAGPIGGHQLHRANLNWTIRCDAKFSVRARPPPQPSVENGWLLDCRPGRAMHPLNLADSKRFLVSAVHPVGKRASAGSGDDPACAGSRCRRQKPGNPRWGCRVCIGFAMDLPLGVSAVAAMPPWRLPQPAAEPTIGPPTLFVAVMAAVSDLLNATRLACSGLQRLIHAGHWCSICDKDAAAKRGDERRNHQQLPHNAVLLFLSPAAAP